jgi:hypothetical protein
MPARTEVLLSKDGRLPTFPIPPGIACSTMEKAEICDRSQLNADRFDRLQYSQTG